MSSLVKCVLLSQLLMVTGKSSRALLCLPCDKSKCEEPEGCPGTLVPDICGCCSVCAKQRHESCGGQQGTCDWGLHCVIRPSLKDGSIASYEVGVCEDENWDGGRPLGFGPCDENLVAGCNIVNGGCECDRRWTCGNPFRFPSRRACQSALRRLREPTYTTMAPPACGAMNNCTLTAEDCSIGFEKDQNGCNTCRCKTREEERGGQLADCDLSCPLGYQMDEQGCRMCLCRTQPKECKSEACGKQCPHGFRKNKHGCDLCSCKKCPELSCDLACPAGLAQDDSGCVICHCKDPPALSITPSAARSEPCLSVDGRRHDDGESWHDGCRDCYCHNGREMCAVIFCRVPACANPSIPRGQCCPSCADEVISHKPEPSESLACPDSGGRWVAEGEVWRLDSCAQCTCSSGQTMCETELCLPAPCQDPVRTPDSCCPRCPGEPLTPLSPGNTGSAPSYCEGEEGAVFLSGESWRPDACSSCVCSDGAVACYSELCPAVGCARPVLRKGQCCPSCAEDAVPRAECLFDGKRYADEERWDLDSCTHCYCLQGQTLCSTVSCRTPPCSDPVSVAGSCCPACSEVSVPLNVPMEKTDHRDSQIHQPAWLVGNEKGFTPQLSGKPGSFQYIRGVIPASGENSPFHVAPWVALSALAVLILTAALLLINFKKKWIPSPCDPTSQPTCLNSRVCVDCHKCQAQLDGSQRILCPTEPNSRYSGYCNTHNQNSLQADSFYQTV